MRSHACVQISRDQVRECSSAGHDAMSGVAEMIVPLSPSDLSTSEDDFQSLKQKSGVIVEEKKDDSGDFDNEDIVDTLYERLDCSGLTIQDGRICWADHSKFHPRAWSLSRKYYNTFFIILYEAFRSVAMSPRTSSSRTIVLTSFLGQCCNEHGRGFGSITSPPSAWSIHHAGERGLHDAVRWSRHSSSAVLVMLTCASIYKTFDR